MTETVTLCLLALAGLAGGLVVAGGVIAMMVGLGVITRYAGITRTAVSVRLYEDAIFLGGMFGNLLTVYGFSCPLGQPALALLGLCSGIFVGGWIMALAEIVNIFPILARRIGFVKGMSAMVISIALGKTLGSLYHFFMRM